MKFPLDQVQEIQISPISNSVWLLAEPNINTIKERLEKYSDEDYYNKQPYTIHFVFEYSFFREVNNNFLYSTQLKSLDSTWQRNLFKNH